MVKKSSTPKKRQPSRPNLLSSSAEKSEDRRTGEQGRRGAVTGRKKGAQTLSAEQKRGIIRRANRARWS